MFTFIHPKRGFNLRYYCLLPFCICIKYGSIFKKPKSLHERKTKGKFTVPFFFVVVVQKQVRLVTEVLRTDCLNVSRWHSLFPDSCLVLLQPATHSRPQLSAQMGASVTLKRCIVFFPQLQRIRTYQKSFFFLNTRTFYSEFILKMSLLVFEMTFRSRNLSRADMKIALNLLCGCRAKLSIWRIICNV